MEATFKPKKSVDATEAKNRFGAISRSTAQGPVQITKHGRPEYVLVRASDYEELLGRAFPETELSGAGQDLFDRIVADQGATIVRGVDPLEGSTDADLAAALARSLEKGGAGR